MDDELEVIRHQMEAKRASLADKLDLLENQVLETVHEATAGVSKIVETVTTTVGTVTENVQDTVSSVKENVQETVESFKEQLTEGVHDTVETVKETLDISQHVRRRPWAALGCSFATGLAGGYLLGGSRSRHQSGTWGARPSPMEPYPRSTEARSFVPPEEPPPPPRFTQQSQPSQAPSQLQEAAMTALGSLKGLAIGALMSVLREVTVKSLPPALHDEVGTLITQMNSKLGGRELGDLGIVESLRGWNNQAASDIHRQATNQAGFRTETGRGDGI